jgi:hypothetical protein
VSGIEITRRPARRSLVVSGAAGVVATTALATAGAAALVAVAGVLVLLTGVSRGRHRLVDAGGFVAFLGVLLGGTSGGSPAAVLVATAATVVAWDAGGNAVSLGRQLGRGGDTARVEYLHALASAGIGVATAFVAFVLFSLGPSGQPVTTLFVLLLAAALLVAALNR